MPSLQQYTAAALDPELRKSHEICPCLFDVCMETSYSVYLQHLYDRINLLVYRRSQIEVHVPVPSPPEELVLSHSAWLDPCTLELLFQPLLSLDLPQRTLLALLSLHLGPFNGALACILAPERTS